MSTSRSMYLALGIALVAQASASAAVRFVKTAPSGSGNCSNWANACTLPSGLTAAQSGDSIWVKTGNYAPFNLKEGVKIIGGFAGTEVSVLQSNPATNPTVVDGDGARAVTGANQSPSTMLRGFTIRNGYAGYDADVMGGGGMLLSDSSALIVQCIFENNTAYVMGGAVLVSGLCSPQFINCIFRNNGSTSFPYEGGAVFIKATSPVSFTNCLFHGNKGGGGGGIAMVPGTQAILTNCTMTNNQASMTQGGAVSDFGGLVTFRNCILWGNTRIQAGSPIADQIYSPGFESKVTYSDVEGGWPGTGNINANPLFTNAAANDFTLQSTSPGKNSGDNANIAADSGDLDWNGNTVEPIPFDLILRDRIIETTVDMGAYEALGPSGPPEPE